MATRPSPATDVARLVRDLSSRDLLCRESAIARLALAGTRAIVPVLSLANDTSAAPAARIAALQTLAATGTPRVIDAARAMLGDGNDAVASEAIESLRDVLLGPEPGATRAFDYLAEFVLSPAAAGDRRLAALAAMDSLPAALLKPLHDALARDESSPLVRQALRRRAGGPSIDDLIASGFSADASLTSAVIRDADDDVRLNVLKRAIDGLRQREAAVPSAERSAWTAMRGTLHQRLAARASKIAVYDLRETIAAAEAPLPVGFLAAASAVGDASCLEPIAQAWVKASAGDRWWKDHLAEAFGAIVRREGISRREPSLARMLRRWPKTAVLVAKASKA